MIEIEIPHFYREITKNHSDVEDSLKKYVIGYMAVSYPELKPVQIKPEIMIVLCERR